MKKLFKIAILLTLTMVVLCGCNEEKEESKAKLQEGNPVVGELSKIVTYKDTDLIVNGEYVSLVKQFSGVTKIISVEKLSETIVGITAKINDEWKYFCFYDIEGKVFMNEVTGSFFYFIEGEMDSLIYYEDGNIFNAYGVEIINVEQFGDSVTAIEYDESQTIATVTIHNSQTGKDYDLAVQNKWKTEE